MTARRKVFLVVAPIAALVAVVSRPALADVTKDQCIDANGDAQGLRREGKLSEARDKLLLCASRSCPAIVRDDCAKRLDELERAQPTVAFEVKDASGADVTAVKVTVDGKPFADRLDGTALRVDIGQHVFTFEVAAHAPITRTLVMTEGEKGRREVIAVETASSPAPAPAASPATHEATATRAGPPETEPRPAGGGMETQRVVGLLAAGVGVAGVAVGSVFGLMGFSEKNKQLAECSPQSPCTSQTQPLAASDRSTGLTDATISTATFIAGGALLAVGGLLFLTGANSVEPAKSTGLVVTPSMGPGGGGMFLNGRF
jgi:hypothetical protein